MALHDLINKEAGAQSVSQEPTEEQIKEAFAAGRIAGAAYRDELGKIANDVPVDDEKGEQGQKSAPSKMDQDAVVDKLKKVLNSQHMAESEDKKSMEQIIENLQKSDGPQPNAPESNEKEDVDKESALRSLIV